MRIVFLFFILFFNIALSQDPYFVKYNIEAGLPTSHIYGAFEDSNGYMWFATGVGVLRFDGYDFKHYNTDDGLADNEILKIYEDDQQRIWFLSLNVELSYYKNKQFYNTTSFEFLKKASSVKMLMDLCEDNSGNLYFLSKHGSVSKIDKDSIVTHYTEDHISSHSLWLIDNNPFVLNKKGIRNLTTKETIKLPEDIIASNVYRSAKGPNKDYYFSTGNNVYRFDGTDFNNIYNTIDKEVIYLKMIDDMLWIGTKNGLIIKKENKIKTYFKNNMISGAIKDSQGNYWVTTLNDGIKFIPDMQIFKQELPQGIVTATALELDNNKNLLIGTRKGLFIKKDSNAQSTVLGIPKFKIPIGNIRVFEDKIFGFNSQSLQLLENSTLTNYSMGAIDVLYDNDNYFLTSSIVFKFNQNEFSQLKHFNPLKHLQGIKENSVIRERTNSIVKGEKNKIFLGTSNGLYMYSNDKIEKVTSENKALHTTISHLYFDKESNKLFIGTNSEGLIILKNNKIVNHITPKQNLKSNSCTSIKKIAKDTYFIGTNKGLNLLELSSDSVKVSDFNTLLRMNNEKINFIEKMADEVYLATDKGLFYFNINNLQENQKAPKVLIDEILVNGNSHTNIKNLKYTENNLTIRYTGISYIDYGNLEYQYTLNKEKEWTTTTSRQFEFKNLQYGNYTLNIRAIGGNGMYSNIETVQFKITPPFWKTMPFILLCIALVFLLVLYFLKRRINDINQRFELQRKALQSEQDKMALKVKTVLLEQKALRLQMNPHFIFNTLNTIKGYYSEGKIADANQYIARFSKLLRLVLETDAHLVSFEKEIEMLELYLKLVQLRYQNVFEYNITVSEDIVMDTIGIPPLLLQPIVENSIVHGMVPNSIKGLLNIDFNIYEDKIICRVVDNGVGVSASKIKKKPKHKSKAIKITEERVQFLNNSKDSDNFKIIEHKNPSGTEVIIKIPILKLW